MLEITRELVEHYLRATGWTFDPNDGWWLGTDASGNKGRAFPASWILAFGLDADVAARMAGHRVNAVTLAFRLGLCAAAERDLEEANNLTMPLGSTGMFTADDEHGAGVLVAAAKRSLADAGIDPAAWESARKR